MEFLDGGGRPKCKSRGTTRREASSLSRSDKEERYDKVCDLVVSLLYWKFLISPIRNPENFIREITIFILRILREFRFWKIFPGLLSNDSMVSILFFEKDQWNNFFFEVKSVETAHPLFTVEK